MGGANGQERFHSLGLNLLPGTGARAAGRLSNCETPEKCGGVLRCCLSLRMNFCTLKHLSIIYGLQSSLQRTVLQCFAETHCRVKTSTLHPEVHTSLCLSSASKDDKAYVRPSICFEWRKESTTQAWCDAWWAHTEIWMILRCLELDTYKVECSL